MAKKRTSTPHDAVFKTFLRHPATARDFLEIYLPRPLREICNLQTLKLEGGSFIEENLRACYSDVLWSLKTRQGDGYIYVLIEHQSRPDAHMAFRLMRYAIAAMQNHLDAGHRQLPLVVPMLFYHGMDSPYPGSLCWFDEFASPGLAKQLYSAAFPLVDITVTPDDEILRHRRVAMLELVQKHIRQRDMMDIIDRLAAILMTGLTNDSQLKTLFNYILQCGDAAQFSLFISEFASRVPQYKESLMTIAERLRQAGWQEGQQQGMIQGIEQGQQQGRHEEALRIARTMLADGIDRELVLKITGIAESELPLPGH